MVVYRFPRLLTLLAWEAEVRHKPLPADDTWSLAAVRDGLRFDFSRVEFADFGALARTLLLLDAAVRHNTTVTVTLPAASALTATERQQVKRLQAAGRLARGDLPASVAQHARARGDALAFMRQVGFIDSLHAPHWSADAVRIREGAAARSPRGTGETTLATEAPKPDPGDAPYRRRRVFPFRWLEPMPAAQLRESESFLAVSAGLEDLGLSQPDARTLSQTVLTELVENVAEHGSDGGRPPFALVGGILLNAETYALRQDGMHAELMEIAERVIAAGSLVLRLIVADSGADLVSRLAPSEGWRPAGPDVRPGRPEDAVLSALGNPPEAAGRGEAGSRGTTGLWWVERVVRSYQGAILVRTGDLLAGRLFGRTDGGTRVARAGFGHIPGMLLELTLPIGRRIPRPRPSVSWEGQASPGGPARLRWVNCAFDPRHGLSDDDRTRLAAEAHEASGLVLTIAVHDSGQHQIEDGWRDAIQGVLEFSSRIASLTAVAVVFPDAEPRMLGLCVAAFNERAAGADGAVAYTPILVIGSHGELAWCGGPPPEPLLSPDEVQQAIDQAVSQSLQEAISQGAAGVRRGVFRGPSLRVTERWIDAEELLAGTIGIQLAAFVLARKVEATLRGPVGARVPTGIVQVPSAPRSLIRHLSECLSLDGRYYVLQAELDISEPPTGERVPADAAVVLCTDVISTENTVRRAAAAIAGGQAEPLVIACVVDAREQRDSVRLLNRTIPVVSLSEADIGAGARAAGPIVNIDPLLLRPDVPAPAPLPPLEEEELLRWCAVDPDVLRLGHVDGPPHHHYTAFIRLQALRQQQTRDQITDAVLHTAREAFAELGDASRVAPDEEPPVVIWCVASEENNQKLAVAVHDRLVAHGRPVGGITEVPRFMAGHAWAFPARLPALDPPGPVLIIHWSAITGSTLMQMVRLAASSGATRIAAVCMLNQMEAHDAEALHMLRAVVPSAEAPRTSAATVEESRPQIPIAIRFVTVSSITALDAHNCPVCLTRERYRFVDQAMPPRLLRHAEMLREMLRRRDLEEVSRDAAADLFRVPLSCDEAVDYLSWRGLLLRGLREVPTRQEVIERLSGLTRRDCTSAWTRAGLIRLLAAEQQWLRLPPLHLEHAKGLLTEVCMSCLAQPTTPPWLRVQALMVLSAAPQRLAELLPSILAYVAQAAALVDQLLLDCYRLLLDPPPDSPIDIERLRQNLIQCRDYLEDMPGDSDADVAIKDEHLHALRELITIADYKLIRKPKDVQAAWERLREDLMRPVIRHRLEAELLLVRGFVEDLEEIEPTPDSARRARADWDICARQLEERALANLPPLRDILAGDFVADWFGHRDQRRILGLARQDVTELRGVTERLHRLVSGPWQPGDASWQTLRREVLDRINWWNRVFLAAHIPDHDRSALLVELVRSAPVRLGDRVADILSAHQANATIEWSESAEALVFCPEKLLDQVVVHLLENVRKHSLSDAVCRVHIKYSRPDPGSVQFTFSNSGSQIREQRGRGLRALNDKLRPFGGKLAGHVPDEEDWTFATVVTLAAWRGG